MKRVVISVDYDRLEGTIVSDRASSTGLLKIQLDSGPALVRHVSRVTPLDQEAAKLVEEFFERSRAL